MTIPYTVKVFSTGDDIKVRIQPQPIATKEQYTKLVTGRFQQALMNPNIRNTVISRRRLRSELVAILTDFHEQGIIKPKED